MLTFRGLIWLMILILATGVTGCGGKKAPRGKLARTPLEKLSTRAYPQFFDSHGYGALEASIDQSLVYFNRVPRTRTFTYGREKFDAAHMIRSLEVFKEFLAGNPSPSDLNRFIKDRYWVYKSIGNTNHEVLFTGYFEPTYPGSLEQDHTYIYPVYSRPMDLLQIDLSRFSEKYKGHKRLMARVDTQTRRVLPYYSREEINAQADFPDKAPPVVWLKNRVDRFFLEIQGSGRVALENGEIIRVHYGGANGNPYRSVGKYLIDQGEVAREDMSMQAIRDWLENNPHRMDEVLHYNKSFVFFKEGQGGPFGNIGVAVTPLRSIATDIKVFPRGALGFVQTLLPASGTSQPKEDWESASLFVLNQDTGGAIKGPGRVDLFCGNGDWAAYAAGHMTAHGQLYFLVIKP